MRPDQRRNDGLASIGPGEADADLQQHGCRGKPTHVHPVIDPRFGWEKARPGRWWDIRNPPVRPNGLFVMLDAMSAMEHHAPTAERARVKKLDVTEVQQIIRQQLVMRFEPQMTPTQRSAARHAAEVANGGRVRKGRITGP